MIAQAPKAGEKVNEKTKVRINVSSGPKPVGVPDVRGSSFDSAASILQGAGFGVGRKDVESDQPVGNVISQDPAAGTFAPPHSTITLTVSKGPKMADVPGVEGSDEATAQSQLEGSGFKVHVQHQDTTDPSLDGIVISQDPAAGTAVKPKSKVTIVVGRYKAPPPGDTTTATTTTVPVP